MTCPGWKCGGYDAGDEVLHQHGPQTPETCSGAVGGGSCECANCGEDFWADCHLIVLQWPNEVPWPIGGAS